VIVLIFYFVVFIWFDWFQIWELTEFNSLEKWLANKKVLFVWGLNPGLSNDTPTLYPLLHEQWIGKLVIITLAPDLTKAKLSPQVSSKKAQKCVLFPCLKTEGEILGEKYNMGRWIQSRVARLLVVQHTKTGRNYQMTTKYIKNGGEIFRMFERYSKLPQNI
jgi:hypothetical protein